MSNKAIIEFGPGALAIESNDISKTAFNEIAVAEFEPQAGWTFPYVLNEAIITKTELFTGTVVQDGSFALISSGIAANGTAFIRSNRSLTYSPGIGAIARFTAVFSEPQPNSGMLIGVGNAEDGWFFGYDGLKFGIMKRRDSIDEWFYQEDWTEDLFPNLNPQKGNVYEIRYQWLGFGMQYFGIENDKGNVTDVHRIQYSNLNDNVSVSNPSLPLAAGVGNTGNTTNIFIKTPSAVAGLQGKAFSPAFEALVAYERILTLQASVETYLFGLQNPQDWLGKDNRLYIQPRLFAAASEGNKPVVFRVYFNPIINTPNWIDVSPNISPLQYDEAGTWIPNGESQVFSLPLGRADNQVVDLRAIDAEIQPRQIFAITAFSQTAADVIVSIDFKSRT